jgi:Ca2+-transporting ATPase
LRSIVYAYKDINADEWEFIKDTNNNFETEIDREALEKNLIFMAAFALNDELRQGVPDAIRLLYEKQINVRMISGDNMYTAIECAKKTGILSEGEEKLDKVVLTGK